MKNILALLLLLFVAACSTPQDSAQTVYFLQGNYAIALRAEIAYDKLPRCGQASSPKVCSDIAIVKRLRTADDVAWDAIQQVQVAVRTPGFGEDKLTTAIASATAAATSFVNITQTLGAK